MLRAKRRVMAWILGAGGMAIAAGLWWANSDFWKYIPKADLSYLNSIKLTSLDGTKREFLARDLWKDQGAVVMVVRRAG